jgi:hypothetical protein
VNKNLQQVTDFIKKYDLRLSILAAIYEPSELEKTRRFWCTLDTRIGLKTITRCRRITAKGVKPVADGKS